MRKTNLISQLKGYEDETKNDVILKVDRQKEVIFGIPSESLWTHGLKVVESKCGNGGTWLETRYCVR